MFGTYKKLIKKQQESKGEQREGVSNMQKNDLVLSKEPKWFSNSSVKREMGGKSALGYYIIPWNGDI